MNNVTFIKVSQFDGTEVEHAIIENEDGSTTSMLKSTYDAQLSASYSTPILPEA